MFVDEAVVRLRAGCGGNGCVSFHREKFIPRGGPDGGDGGHGGSIFLRGDPNLATLYDISLHPSFHSEDGTNGRGNKMHGRAGKDLTVRVPIGTEVFDEISGEFLVDIVTRGQSVLIARGGRGGGGNIRFASKNHRLPRFALRGAPGQNRKIRLSLKLLSDLSIVGLPNAGKSTLLAALTAAHPKIADYPFTTLTPNLGVIRGETESIILADIPGLIEGAHAGRGLGNQFLKHIERSRAILILLDASQSPVEDYKLLRDEIMQFNPAIWDRPRAVALNKIDLVRRPGVKTLEKKIGKPVIAISAKDGTGIEKIRRRIENLAGPKAPAEDTGPMTLDLDRGGLRVSEEAGATRLRSAEWEELASMIPKENAEAMQWFMERLRTAGVFRVLEKSGHRSSDLVRIGALEIQWRATETEGEAE